MNMDRLVYKDLLKWKNSPERKPLVLYGARQVGKTWLLKDFGQREFKRFLYLNFDADHTIHSFFGDDISPLNIIRALENYFNEKIDPSDTLLIFDEIQECQRAKDSLKYFNEDAPQYRIAAAGSFLGIAGGKFPVGQVNELTLYPLSFSEFLEAVGRSLLASTLRENVISQIAASHGMLSEKLKEYLFVGGMPEAVKAFAETGSFLEVRRVQELILNNYKNDFSKHISAVNIPKVRMLWDSIPAHLAREKKKFIYKEVKAGGRASEFENALNWLVSTGLVYKVERTTTVKIPLSAYIEREHFKIYMLDVGLLCAKAGLVYTTLMAGDKTVFTEFKGALAEQFVLQELKVSGHLPVFYWGSATGKAELDFIFQHKNEIIPIEVKSSVHTKSQSLSVYMEKNDPHHAVRISLKNYGQSGCLFSVPLYMIGRIDDIVADSVVLPTVAQRPYQ
jgi:predicted AAA+ superfamily ATPase